MNPNKSNNKKTILKPIQAGDYGKDIPQTQGLSDNVKNADTDGRKTLALWS